MLPLSSVWPAVGLCWRTVPFLALVVESVTRLTLKPASSISWVASASVFPTTLGTSSGPSDQNRVTFEPSATWVPAGRLHLDDLVLGVVGVALGEHHAQPLAPQLVGGIVLVLPDHVGQGDLRLARRRPRSRPWSSGVDLVTGLRLLRDDPSLGDVLAGGGGHLADLEPAVADGSLGLRRGSAR